MDILDDNMICMYHSILLYYEPVAFTDVVLLSSDKWPIIWPGSRVLKKKPGKWTSQGKGLICLCLNYSSYKQSLSLSVSLLFSWLSSIPKTFLWCKTCKCLRKHQHWRHKLPWHKRVLTEYLPTIKTNFLNTVIASFFCHLVYYWIRFFEVVQIIR